MLIGKSPNSSVLRKCSVLFSIDFWGAKPRPWPLYIHGSAYTQARNFFSDQIYPYQNKLFKTSWINYIFYFNWLRKAVILQAWHCLRPKLLWFRWTSWVLISTVQSPTCIFQVSNLEVTTPSEVPRTSKNQSYRSFDSIGRGVLFFFIWLFYVEWRVTESLTPWQVTKCLLQLLKINNPKLATVFK